MKIKIYQHKGIIGIESDHLNSPFISKVGNGNLGCTVDGKDVQISPEALELLKDIKEGRGSLGDIECFEASDGSTVFGWIGGFRRVVIPSKSEGGRGFNPSLLTPTSGIEADPSFIDYVEQTIL